jgi:hypothetical protein
MNHLSKPGIPALLLAVLVLGLAAAPAVFADGPGSLSYQISGPAGGMVQQASPVWQPFAAGSYPMIGSVSAFGSVSSWSPSSQIEYHETVSADGVITNFVYSFHYEGSTS